MVTTETIMDTLRGIDDPEMPISIVDLGLIESVSIDGHDDRATVAIDLLPTFVGCPALEMIANDITAALAEVDGVGETSVRMVYDPPWSVTRISPAGRERLRAHGVTVPETGSTLPVAGHSGGAVELRASVIKCPFCGSDQTTLESTFGPTRCRMICYCRACRNSFEHMKRV